MTSITCRYCSFYAPCVHTPIIGDCAGVFPPKRVQAINSECPFKGDSEEISKQISARGFYGHDLRRLEYFGIDRDGLHTRTYQNLDDLINDISSTGAGYTLYVRFIDSDNRVFARAVIPGGTKSAGFKNRANAPLEV